MRALITGASSGLGAAFAEELARLGYQLVLVARDEKVLTDFAARLTRKYQVAVETLPADLAQPADLARVLEICRNQRLDLVINNAGFAMPSLLQQARQEATQSAGSEPEPGFVSAATSWAVMGHAVWQISVVSALAMRGRGSGQIINVSSLAGYLTNGGYSALKAWVKVFSEALAVELAGSGVRVMAFCPGWIKTDFHRRGKVTVKFWHRLFFMKANTAARRALADAEAGKVVSIPAFGWRILAFAYSVMPRKFGYWCSSRLAKR